MKIQNKINTLIEELLSYASNPNKSGSKKCLRKIAELEGDTNGPKLTLFLREVYEAAARPYRNAPTEIRALVERFTKFESGKPRCDACGSTESTAKDVQGKLFPWLSHGVEVTVPLFLQKCKACENFIRRHGIEEVIDVAIIRSILKQKSQVIGPDFFWLEINEETGLPAGGVTSAWYGLSDKPHEGNWILVRKFSFNVNGVLNDKG